MIKPLAWLVQVLHPAEKTLARLPRRDRARILEALESLQDAPFQQDIKPLKGRPLWRLRIGPWRAVVRFDQEARTIFVLSIGPRGDVYK